MKQGVMQVFPASIRIPCDTWGCRSGQMASHFIGRPENPKNVLTNICPTCLDELKDSIYDLSPAAGEEGLQNQIDTLADFLLANYPDEIGAGDPVNGESAVEVAIRLLQPSGIAETAVNNATITELNIPSVTIAKEDTVPFEPETPETEEVFEIDGKLITEYTVPELKKIAKEEGLSDYSDKNKGELIVMLTAHFEKSEE